MTRDEFRNKYQDICGKDCNDRIKEWYEAGYLGKTTKINGKYNFPENVPLPFYANKNVSTVTTLTRDILKAADYRCSVYPGMYPKIPADWFDSTIQDCIDVHFIRSCYTEDGDPFIELTIDGMRFLEDHPEKERNSLYNKAAKLAEKGLMLLSTLKQLEVI